MQKNQGIYHSGQENIIFIHLSFLHGNHVIIYYTYKLFSDVMFL